MSNNLILKFKIENSNYFIVIMMNILKLLYFIILHIIRFVNLILNLKTQNTKLLHFILQLLKQFLD